jgi:hypothetical protein
MYHDRTGCLRRRLRRSYRRPDFKVSNHNVRWLEFLFIVPLAVRKNRYVILPVDFEEAWKVRVNIRHVGTPVPQKFPVHGQTRRRHSRILCVLLNHANITFTYPALS